MNYPLAPDTLPSLGPTTQAFFDAHDYLVLTPARNAVVARCYDADYLAELQNTAVAVAVEATRFVTDSRVAAEDSHGHVLPRDTKSSTVDPVTAVDQGSEKLIRELLFKRWPASQMLGEEDGRIAGPDAANPEGEGRGVMWVIDPIDGTVNFMYGLPAYAVSIAALIDGYPVATAVADVARGRIFSARVSGGAQRVDVQDFQSESRDSWRRILGAEQDDAGENNGEDAGERESGDEQAQLLQSLAATGFSYLAERRSAQAELLGKLLPRVRDIRRIGSAAIDLCLVAQRRVDLFYEHGLGPWDYFGGALIASETGVAVAVPPESVGSNQGKVVLAAREEVFGHFAELVIGDANGGILAPVSRS